METYIRKSIAGYFAQFPEEIDPTYWQGWIGTTYEDFERDMWIHLSAEQVAFYHEHPYATIKEIIAMSLEPETLEEAKARKIDEIKEYDLSDAVDSFDVTVGGMTMSHWLTPDERANYKNSVDSAEIVGREEVHPMFNGVTLTIPTKTAKLYLAQIQLYADGCWMVTEGHKAAVNALESIEAVDAYDFRTGYPERLSFTL